MQGNAAAWPPALARAVARWGQPVGVQEARTRWAELVTAAESGTATLLTWERSGWAWAVLVPLSELYESQWLLPVHSLSGARPVLGDLVRAAQGGTPQVLHRHHRAVAALMTADRIITAAPGERLDVDRLLRDGATITLSFAPGVEGRCDEDGEVCQEPEPEYVLATAIDPTGVPVGVGTGASAAEALALLHRRPTEPPIEYATKPPFQGHAEHLHPLRH